MEEKLGYPNQSNKAAEPSKDSREKKRIQWPSADDKLWMTFDEDLNKILENTLTGEVHKKLVPMLTTVYAVGQERFWTKENQGRQRKKCHQYTQ